MFSYVCLLGNCVIPIVTHLIVLLYKELIDSADKAARKEQKISFEIPSNTFSNMKK